METKGVVADTKYSAIFKPNERVSSVIKSLDRITRDSDYVIVDSTIFPSGRSFGDNIFSENNGPLVIGSFLEYLPELFSLDGLCLSPEVKTRIEKIKSQERKAFQKSDLPQNYKYIRTIDEIKIPDARELQKQAKEVQNNVNEILLALRPTKFNEVGLIELDHKIFAYAFTIALASPDKRVSLLSTHGTYAQFFDLFYELMASNELGLNGEKPLVDKVNNINFKFGFYNLEDNAFEIARNSKEGKRIEEVYKINNPISFAEFVKTFLKKTEGLNLGWEINNLKKIWDGKEALDLEDIVYFEKRNELKTILKFLDVKLTGITKDKKEEFQRLKLDLSTLIDYLSAKSILPSSLDNKYLKRVSKKFDEIETEIYGKKKEPKPQIKIDFAVKEKPIRKFTEKKSIEIEDFEEPEEDFEARYDAFVGMLADSADYDITNSWILRKAVRDAAGLGPKEWKDAMKRLDLEKKESSLLMREGDTMMRFDADFFKALIMGLDL